MCRCENKKCKRRKDCLRFKDADGELMQFKNICHKVNGYKWFIKRIQNLPVK